MFLTQDNLPVTINSEQAGKLLGFQSVIRLQNKAKKGLIPGAFKAGRNWMFYTPSLIEYIKRQAEERNHKKYENQLWRSTKDQAHRTTIHASHSAVSECVNLREQLREAKRKSTKKS